MYCRPTWSLWDPSGNVFYFINKVLFYRESGSRVMMQCLCYIKTYINAQYSLSRTEIKFYLTPERNTIFLSEPNNHIKRYAAEHDSYLVENWDTETLIDFLKE